MARNGDTPDDPRSDGTCGGRCDRRLRARADAGKPCTDGDQCEGDCRAEPSDGPPKPGTVTGVCQADSDPCGCFTTIEDGQVAHAICVD